VSQTLLVMNENDNMATLQIHKDGSFFVPCQVTDYSFRGDMLEDKNVFNFFLDSYDSNVETSAGRHSRVMYKTGRIRKYGLYGPRITTVSPHSVSSWEP
jgi:hypothetical protein